MRGITKKGQNRISFAYWKSAHKFGIASILCFTKVEVGSPRVEYLSVAYPGRERASERYQRQDIEISCSLIRSRSHPPSSSAASILNLHTNERSPFST